MAADDFGGESQELTSRGYVHLPRAGTELLVSFLEHLGRVLHVEEVRVEQGGVALLKTSEALALHTDHARADVIVWHCLSQASSGGDTLLLDGYEAWNKLDSETRRVLETVRVSQHRVFRDDDDRHPVVTWRAGRPLLYFTSWLFDEQMPAEHHAALKALEASIRETPAVSLRLLPGDILAVDNHRMLHGRTAIVGEQLRHLRRYWVAT